MVLDQAKCPESVQGTRPSRNCEGEVGPGRKGSARLADYTGRDEAS